MKGYVVHLEKETLKNEDYRKVLYTTKKSQLVLMSIEPNSEVGEEVHTLDQFIRFEAGEALVTVDGVIHKVGADWAVVIPAGSVHNVKNIGDTSLKLYSLYTPPEHKEGTVHSTKEDDKEEHFDGVTSE